MYENENTNERKRLPGTPEPTAWLSGHNGLKIAADCWGNPEAPLVLLLHGGGQTRHAWKGTGLRLAEAGFRVYSLDSRGHGDSDWDAAGDYHQDAMVADLSCVVQSLAAPEVILVGASMGGSVALCAAGEGRINSRAVVLVDIAPRIEEEGAQRIVDFMRGKPQGFDNLEEVADAIAAYQPQRTRPRALDGLKKNVRLDANGRIHWHWDPAWLNDDRIGDIEARFERMQHAAAALTRQKLPTLLVRGGLSDVLSEAGAAAFLETCPHADYVNITGAAHMVAGDRNDVFTNAIVDFLKKLNA